MTRKKMIKKGSSSSTFTYAPALESSALVKLKKGHQLFINGRFVPAADHTTMNSINPATGKLLTKFSVAKKRDADKAVQAATKAYHNVWSKMPGIERGKYLFRISRILQIRAKEFAVLESLDSGKPIKESRDFDIPLAAAHFFYYAGWADKLNYCVPGQQVSSLGVVGQIIPWNFPLLMAAWKIAPALAAGNCVVLKPAETTPLTALLLAEVCQEAELPPGVVNIITGPATTGQALVNHPAIKKIAFTGSTEVGKLIAKTCAEQGKLVTLELGGKSANIVFEDAAIDQAIEGIVNGIYFNQGQVCCAGSRLLVEESIQETIIKKLKRRINTLRIGDPMDKNTDIGAINSAEQFQKIKKLVKAGKAEGGYFYESTSPLPSVGFFHRPCFISQQSSANLLNRVEVFGPVLSIQSFRTPDEAIAKANDTPYGLAAGIWSDKGSKIQHIAQALKAGVIWANTYNKFDPAAPFGGYKESGIGREGGLHGLLPYLEIKS